MVAQNEKLDHNGATAQSGGGSVTAAITLPNTDQSRNYNLDGLGNWTSSVYTPEGTGSAITDQRNHNKLNEIIQRTVGTSPAVTFQYDGVAGASNGNLVNDGTLAYSYDSLNRPIQINRVSDGLIIATYLYDAMNRRIRKTILNGGLTGSVPNSTTDYIWSGSQVVEERNASNAPIRQYIWGTYIDECIQLNTLTPLGPQSLPAGAYYLPQDLLYRAVALTNSSGSVVEAYDTGAYGNTLIFTAPGTDGVWFTDDDTQSSYGGNEIIYCGYHYDPETELYYVRNRTYNPVLGRWIQRDPIGYAGGVNLYEYVGGRAVVVADPTGTDRCSSKETLAWLAIGAAGAAGFTAAVTCATALAPEPGEPIALGACITAIISGLVTLATAIALQQDAINCENARRCPNRDELKQEKQELQRLRQQQRKLQEELNQLRNLIKPPLPTHIRP